MYKKTQAIEEAKAAIRNYSKQKNDLMDEAAEMRQACVKLEHEREETFAELAQNMISKLDNEQIERVCAELGSTELQGMIHKAHYQLEQNQRRVSEIDADQEYAHRGRLLHPQSGPYIQERNQHQEKLTHIKKATRKYEFKEFYWLYGKGFHKPKPPSGFKRFMRTIVLSGLREKRAMVKVSQRLGSDDFSALVTNYVQLAEEQESLESKLYASEEKIQYILNLIKEKQELEQHIANHDEETLILLRESLTHTLNQANLAHVHSRIRPAARILIARAHATQKKIAYLEKIHEYLQAEATDRDARTRSIQSVLRKWQPKPYGLKARKTKWLVDVPKMKHEGTQKRLQHVRAIRHNIVAFRDFRAFSVLMHEMGEAMLAYDAFGMAAGSRMPYEGFSRSILNELDMYRETFRQKNPDYRSYRRIVKEHDNYIETDWEVWDEDDYYEDQLAEAMAEEWGTSMPQADMS